MVCNYLTQRPQLLDLVPFHCCRHPDSITFASHGRGSAWLQLALHSNDRGHHRVQLTLQKAASPMIYRETGNKYVLKENITYYSCGTKLSCSQDYRSNSDLFLRYFPHLFQIFFTFLQRYLLVCDHGWVPNSSLPNTVIHLFVFYTLFDFSHICLWLRALSICFKWLISQTF